MKKWIITFAVLFLSGNVLASFVAYVNVEKTDEYLAPTATAKITNTLYLGQKVDVFEEQKGFSRVSKFYDGKIEGKSGQVARWVISATLSKTPVTKPVVQANTALEKAISGSDDFTKYKVKFTALSQKLLDSGKCSLADFKEQGGWWRSSTPNLYFTYCGGMSLNNKIYINIDKNTIGR